MIVGKCPILWGQCNVVEDALRVVRYRDVFLHQWSIYDSSGRMIEDSGFFRAFPDYVSVGGPLRVEPPETPACMPEGDVFWLGFFEVQFGHFLIGTLARLWALAQHTDSATRIAYVGAAEPDALYGIEHVRLCLEALGVRQEQLLRVEGPMRFPSLTIAEPSFIENFSASPVYGRMMRAIGDGILGTSSAGHDPQADIWLSRALIVSGNRIILNETELTDGLARRGFTIEHPERLGFADQLRLWSRTRIGMGFASSAFHTTALLGGRQLCTLSHNVAASSNQVLIDRVCGNRSLFLHAADGVSDEQTTVPGFSAQVVIHDPAWLADELARIADAFRDRRIVPQSVSKIPRHSWKTQAGPASFGEDMVGQGRVTAQRTDGRITRWQAEWKSVRSISTVRLRDRSGSATVEAFSLQVSGNGIAWVTIVSPQTMEAMPGGSGETVFTCRVGYPAPARFVRLDVRPDAALDLDQIAVFGEPLDAEVGLPPELMHAVLARRRRGRPSETVSRILSNAAARLSSLAPRRSTGHKR